jgi:hypothetical protein
VTIVLHDPIVGVLAILVAIFGVGRLTRVIVHDDFPPAMWWRDTWKRITNDGPWSKLFLCWWCLSFWVSLACIGHALLATTHEFWFWSWWIFWGALALSYVATMVIVRDEPKE